MTEVEARRIVEAYEGLVKAVVGPGHHGCFDLPLEVTDTAVFASNTELVEHSGLQRWISRSFAEIDMPEACSAHGLLQQPHQLPDHTRRGSASGLPR